jgi:hypothetical protein
MLGHGKDISRASGEGHKKMNIPRQLPLKKIREKCLECCGNQYSEVRFCSQADCPLWFLRFGKMPQTIIKKQGPDEKELFNQDNFKDGGRYDPNKTAESLG